MGAIVVHKSGVAMRRDMAKMPEVISALDTVERAVFIASTDKVVADYTSSELVAELQVALKWIAKDVGYRASDDGDMQYLVIRVAEILKRYYATLSLKDFRLAFEMAITGELREYLKDSGHYQQFNAEYICKILNAYKCKRGVVLQKAGDAVPKPEVEMAPDKARYYRNKGRQECIDAYYHYKYRGRMPVLNLISQISCYNVLSDVGLATEMSLTMEEQRDVLAQTLNAFAKRGLVGDMLRLQRDGVGSDDLRHRKFVAARRKALEETFAWMVKNEVQITDYVKFE